MDDTISRAAALDALGERPVVWSDNDDYTLGERNQYDMDRLAIETVPSAQPVNIAKLQPNCNQVASDCISREAAIETVRKAQSIGQAHRMLLQLPSVTPKQPGWIPTSVRLPKPEDEVLLTMDYRGRRCVELGNIWSDGTVHTYVDEYLTPDGRKYRKVVAWCELPTPYREGGQDNGAD